MLIVIALAALGLLSVAALLWPLFRPARPVPGAGAADVAIYRADLESLDRDLAGGRMSADDADAARAEIGRRLIRAARQDDPAADAPADARVSRQRRLAAAAIVVLFVPAFSALVYSRIGAPWMPDRPLAGRLEQARQSGDVAALVARVEARLESAPDDGRGWAVIAPVYLRLGRTADAVTAYRNAIRLLGADGALEAGLGEALVQAAGGIVTAEAEAAFRAALERDPRAIRPRFFLALEKTQAGERQAAMDAWRQLLDGAPPDAAWAAIARQQLEALTAPGEGVGVPAGGEDIARLPPAAQREAIADMVGALDRRLATQGGSVDAWLRLMRARLVLDDRAGAEAAFGRARAAFSGDAESRDRLDAGARALGLAQP